MREFRASLGEYHVGAGLCVRAYPLNGRVEPFDCDRVGARDNQEGGVGAGVECGMQPVQHFVRTHELLAGAVAAALELDLVFDVHRRRALPNQRARSARDAERPAEAGVHVNQ